jgi:RNA polymerase sigma-70 factor (ECF subfamily)
MTTWLFGICMRVASERRRSARARREVLVAGEGAGDPIASARDAGPDAERATERRQQRALLDRILDALSLDQRAVFVLFELEEKSGDEIAELLDIPTGTVHSRLRLAREAFRAALARLQASERFRHAEGA